MKGIPSIEALENVHTFPGPYTMKIIGKNSDAFKQEIQETAESLLDSDEFLEVSQRTSSKGKNISLTLRFFLKSANKVRMIYMEMTKNEQIVFIM